MAQVELRRCEYARCGDAAVYGYKEEGHPRYCAQHRTPDMVSFLHGAKTEAYRPAPAGEMPIYAPQTQQQYGQQQPFDVEANAYTQQNNNYGPPPPYPGTYDAFQNEDVRRAFTTKVFSIVLLQLLITTIIIVVCRWNQTAHDYIQNNSWVYWTSWAVAFAAVIVLACSGNARRTYPINYIILGIVTLGFSFLLAVLTTFYDADVVAYALIITTTVVASCVVLAVCLKVDFTKMRGILMIMTVGLLVALFIGIFWANNTLFIVIGAIGAVLFSLFLIHDIQLIMGGRKYEIGVDEYVMAALMLYLDVIMIFQYILLIFGAARG